jgi:aminoglycoside 3-N-acetyltransferase
VWKLINDIDWNDDDFDALGADFERACAVKIGPVGSATARLFAQRAAVDFAAQWIAKKQSATSA